MRWLGGIPPVLWAVLMLCATSTSLAQCPQGYSAGSQSGLCLLAGGGPKTFVEAEDFCASNGSHLATIFDENVLSDVLEVCAAASGGNETCFVGARLERETRYPNYSSCSIGQSHPEWRGSRWVWRDSCAGVLVDLWSWYGTNITAPKFVVGGACTVTQASNATVGLYPAMCDQTAGFVCAQPGGCPSLPTSTSASKGTPVMAEQVAALQSIKSAVDCDVFNLLDSWEGDYACTYRGVFCVSTGEVVGLVLEDFALQGTLHPAVGNLTKLGFMHIPGNHFAGTLPEEINQLKLLAELDMSDNEFGGLFPNISGLTGLVYLDMRFNKFFGPIPDWVYSLPLDVLVLNNNNFTGPLSYAVGELKNASLMILAHNSLKSAIPESIGQLQSLAQLILLNNSLGSNETNATELSEIDSNTFSEAGPALPYSITNLSTLLLLDVSRNKLEGDLPPTLHRMEGLVEMALSENIITGEFPPNITALANLTSLDLSDNVLQGDIAPAFEIPNLKRLVLRGNYLTGTIPKNNITLVDVSGNCIIDSSGGEQKPDDTCAIFYGRVVYEFWRHPKKSENVILRLWAVRPRYLVRFVFVGGNHTIKGTGSSVDMFHGHGTGDDVRGEGYTFRRFFRGESIYGYTCAVHHNHYGSVRVLAEGDLENKTYTFSNRGAICKEANPCAYIGDKDAQCISQPSKDDFPFVCSCSAGWTFIGYSCYPGKRRANPYPSSASAGGTRGGNNNGGSSSPSTSSPGTEKPTLPLPPSTSDGSSEGDASDPCSSGGEYFASCRAHGDKKARCRLEVCNEAFTCLCSPGFCLVKDIRPADGKKMSTCKPSDASGGCT